MFIVLFQIIWQFKLILLQFSTLFYVQIYAIMTGMKRKTSNCVFLNLDLLDDLASFFESTSSGYLIS